jgi:signal transduction histidine kinase
VNTNRRSELAKEQGPSFAGAVTAQAVGASDTTDSGRLQTDESLRVERDKVDDALQEIRTDIDEIADAVMSRARMRADKVLAGARARADRQTPPLAPAATIKTERALEDKVLQTERAEADETVREERTEDAAVHSPEREKTDRHLSDERSRSDIALEMRDEFLGIVSHDLLNMLTAVIGFAALIERRASNGESVEEIRGLAQKIQHSGARMDRLIGDLVDIASIEAGMLAVTREVGDPSQVVAEALESFEEKAAAGRITLVAEIESPSALVLFDPARILQVLTNLLSNAIKFTPADGKVVLRLQREGDEMCFGVMDTGIGIPRDKLEAVFGRFIQIAGHDRRGLGLGLYISKSIMQGHGGRIWATSSIGKGSTFSFALPVHAGPA